MPRVSIVIPTFNRLAMLEEAVRSALAQRHPDLEVLVSDNASDDGTEAAMQAHRLDPRFRYHRNATNLGMVGNWRKAVLELARGDWFLILSDDDLLLDADYVAKAMALVDRHPQVALVYAEGLLVDEATGTRQELRLPFGEVAAGPAVFAARDRVRPMDFTLCNVLFRRSLALELDAFDDPRDICCDSVLFLESCLLGDVGVIHEPVSLYRLHGANLLKRQTDDLAGYAASLAYYTRPRRMAVERGALTPAQLAAFDEAARRAIRRAILRVARRRPGAVGEFVGHLRRADPPLLEAALRHPLFRLKLAARRLAGRLRPA
jgi:glycosyltransferase involved in cell wall biosynthesis